MEKQPHLLFPVTKTFENKRGLLWKFSGGKEIRLSHLVCRKRGFLRTCLHIPHDQRLLVIGHHYVPFWRDDVNAQVAEVAAGKDMKNAPYSVEKKKEKKHRKTLAEKKKKMAPKKKKNYSVP